MQHCPGIFVCTPALAWNHPRATATHEGLLHHPGPPAKARTMDKINISFGLNQSLALSESRIQKFLDGNNAAAQKMGWFDTFKDQVFGGGAKQAALQQLAQEFDAAHGLSAFEKFERLAQYATAADRSQFTVTNEGPQQAPNLTYSIKGTPVKHDQVSAQAWSTIETRLGQVTGLGDMGHPRAADWLGQHERQDLEAERNAVTDDAFREGGVHKRFDPRSGVLRAEDNTGACDFDKERLVEERAATSDSLARYVSTQKVLSEAEKSAMLPGISSNKAHATVTLYDQAHVTSGELDRQIGTLSAREAHSVLMQTVDMARVFYQNGMSHQDLHMHNLMVHKPVDQSQNNITLKAIDFGKSKVGVTSESDRLNDVRYLFHKQASSGKLETMRRDAREYFNYDMDKQAKHYPLHKLMGQCASAALGGQAALAPNAFDEAISRAGDQLIAQLQHAETLDEPARTQAIDAAFDLAMNTLSATSDHFSRPHLPDHFVRA